MNAIAQRSAGRLRFAINISARLVQLVTGFASVLLLVRVLEPADLGTFYMSTAAGIVIALAPLNFLHFPIQRLMPGDGADRQDFLASHVRLPAILSVALWIAYGALSATAWDVAPLLALVCAYALSEVVFAQGTNIASSLFRPTAYFLAVTTRSVVVLGSLVLLSPTGGTATDAMAIYSLGALLPFYIFLPEMRQSLWKGRARAVILKETLAFGWPYTVSQGFRQVVERGDRILVGVLLGPVIAGQYSVAVDLARRVIQGVTINARFSFVREAVEAYDAGDVARTNRALRSIATAVAVVGLPVAGGIAVFGEDLLTPLLGARFDVSALAILPIVAFVFVIEAYRLYLFALAFELTKKAYLDAVVSVVGATMQITLIIIFAKTGGLSAVAYSLIVTQLVMAAISIFLSRTVLNFFIPIRQAISSVLVTMVLVTCALNVFGYWNALGWVELLGLAIIFGAIHVALMIAVVAMPIGWR